MYRNVDNLYKQIKKECKRFDINYDSISDDSLDLIIETYNWLIGNKYENGSWVKDHEMDDLCTKSPEEFERIDGNSLIYAVMENHLLNLDLEYKDGTEIRVNSIKPAVDQLGEFLEDRYGMKYIKGDNNAT